MSNVVSTTWPSGSTNAGWPQEPSAMLMPGRVQGWPAGTQRAANAAQRLLSQAVAWWDVEQYRDGDRFLRNRGTGGELLDLRLGSSIVANTNDPLYLPVDPQGSGYVYLSGVAGNSLSVTAPATATNYVAYPLDRSASTSTGSVTGGATFTFSTTGSWLKIELLDSSNVVLDTIDCDAITSGSNTSFASALNQTVSVNRSTSGRKSVAVPSRHKGGRPVMLLGTDDYLEIPAGNGWQHALLNFDTGQAYTILWVGRQWTGTVALSARFTKGGTNNTGPGWIMSCLESTGRMGFYLGPSGSVYLQSEATPSPAFGPVVVATAVRNGVLNGLRLTANTVTGTNSSTLTGQETASTGTATRIGTTGGLANFGNFEWYGGAVWRRALTNAEVTSLNSYFTGRIA